MGWPTVEAIEWEGRCAVSFTVVQLETIWHEFEEQLPMPMIAIAPKDVPEYSKQLNSWMVESMTQRWEYRFTVLCLILLEAGEELP